MDSPKCKFIRLLGRSIYGEEIIVRVDSIVEVWLSSGKYITILYEHPDEDRLVEHEESYDDELHARQRFWMIMRIIGAEYQIERATSCGFTGSIKREFDNRCEGVT